MAIQAEKIEIPLKDEDLIANICIQIGSERDRQIAEKKYDYAHDKLFNNSNDLATMAAYYAADTVPYGLREDRQPANGDEVLTPLWPWIGSTKDTKHKHDRRQQLIIAAALIVAEIERIDTDGFKDVHIPADHNN